MLLLGACGLQADVRRRVVGHGRERAGTIQVAPIPERAGWLVRNALVDRLGGEIRRSGYRLEVELDDDLTAFGIRGDSAATRERRTLRARYRLVDLKTGEVVLDATAGSDAGIDIVSSEYATVAAEQTAQERLARLIADQMVSRLALFVRNRRAMKAAKASLAGRSTSPIRRSASTCSTALTRRVARACGPVAEGPGLPRNSPLSAQAVKSDPATLADEAGAISLFGGKRAIWIEPAGDEIAEGVEALLEAPASESPVIAIAGSLRKTSALLKLAEAHPAALSHISYVPEGRDLERLVVDLGREPGLRVAPELARRIAAAAAGNQAIVMQELAKFALYLGRGPRQSPGTRPGHGRSARRGFVPRPI